MIGKRCHGVRTAWEAVFVRHTTFRYVIDPTATVERALRRHEGAARYAFNQSLWLHLNARKAKAEKVPWSGFDLINAFNAWKKGEAAGRIINVAPNGTAEIAVTGLRWRSEVCQQVFEEAAVDCGRALGAWTDSHRGKRQSRKVGHPRFKRKTERGSFRVRNKTAKSGRSAIRVGVHDPRSVTLAGIGAVRVFDDTRPLRRLLAKDRGKILFATVRRTAAGRWTVSLNVAAAELHDSRCHAGVAESWVGVDRGLTALAVVADSVGDELLRVGAPRALTAGLEKQRRLAKAVSRKPKRSANRRTATRRLARHHEHVANRRKHFIHQVTNGLVKTHDRICVEDLNVAGMLHNPKLARHIADAAWAAIHHQLAYKQAWAGGQLAVCDRWFPSSKTCSACGEVRETLSLADRVFECSACGLKIDRDLNAAINLAAWAENHAQAPERQADARDTNARREERSGPPLRADETSLCEAGTHRTIA